MKTAGVNGFDLLAAGAEGEAVDALEDAALAPFDVVGLPRWRGIRTRRGGGGPCISMARKALVDVGGVEREEGGEGGGGGWAEDL